MFEHMGTSFYDLNTNGNQQENRKEIINKHGGIQFKRKWRRQREWEKKMSASGQSDGVEVKRFLKKSK